MTTQLIPIAHDIAIHEQTDTIAHFDASILAGTKSRNTIQKYADHFREYCEFAGNWGLATRPATLARWRQHLFEEGYYAKRLTYDEIEADDGKKTKVKRVTMIHKDYSVNAINLRIAAIRSVMAAAKEQGFISRGLADDFKDIAGIKQSANLDRRSEHARTRISKAEMDQLIAAPDPTTPAGAMNKAFLLVLATAGLRVSEATTLKYSDIRWEADHDGILGWHIFTTGKNQSEPKPKALAVYAKRCIDEWREIQRDIGVRSEYIFTSFGGRGSRNPSNNPISRNGAWRMVQRYAKAVGLEHIKPHDFRRYVGTQLANDPKRGLKAAQDQLGHVRLATTAENYVLGSVRSGITDDLVTDPGEKG